MSAAPGDPLIGRLIDGRYQVRSRIARGGMATVYLATDQRLDRLVAVKIMHGHLADDSQFKERFIQEARSAARLAHPNVVNVFDQGQDAESAYLVMEYLPGITLRELLQDYGALTPEQTLDIGEAVLSGLSAAHKAGIVHRDLKPENVLLADDGRIKIGDFGLARAASANTATGAALLGTIAYLSPELITRGIADTRSDIYALGIMMFEMLTGEQPFKGEQPMQIAYQHANDSVPAPSTVNPDVPAELDELVLWATSREPADRPADARALLEQLRETARSLATSIVATGPQKTMVLPPLSTYEAATAETQVIAPLARPTARPVEPQTPAQQLALAAPARRRRGVVLMLIVLLVAGLAALGGWWFSAGPGGTITVPEVAGVSEAEARATLTDSGLIVLEPSTLEYSLDVEAGRVIRTDPAAGTALPRDAEITLIVSQGAEPTTLPDVRGAPEADARAALEEAGFVVAEERSEQFDGEIADGSVLAVRDADGQVLEAGAASFRGTPVSLLVSVGAIPEVRGLTVDAAVAELARRGLTGVVESSVFDNDIPDGSVIGYSAVPEVVVPGDTLGLVASQGPDLVDIPDVIGLTINEAIDALQAAEFEVNVETNVPESFLWNFTEVQGVSPSQDGQAVRGSEITIEAFV
ncbi:MAG TPA: Stk1 family PASTA domain-containing Ser/Thr kinase [Microcella sp.]|nr:Stk1 family PASTA domain-containing Ser/Thr kinase [Microcella sp.]